jgi:hypothetical protein
MRIKRPTIRFTRLSPHARVIQAFLDRSARKNYLEIGVETGTCFLKIRARRKIAVDPDLSIGMRRRLKYVLRNPCNIRNVYAEMASDEFFARYRGLLEAHPPAVVFVDGLHTYEQSLKDVLNALEFIGEDGVVVVHDCNPGSAAAAEPAASIHDAAARRAGGWSGEWSGDVWKTIVHLRRTRDDLDVCVLDCDHGVGIIRRAPERRRTAALADPASMTYEDLATDRRAVLDLRPGSYLDTLLAGLNATQPRGDRRG